MAVLKSTTNGTTWVKVNGQEGARGAIGPPGPPMMGRNKFMNADMSINQRIFPGATNFNGFGLDRWYMGSSGGTVVWSTLAIPAETAAFNTSATRHARVAISGQGGAGDYAILAQGIEDVRTLAGRPATLSFWARVISGYLPWVAAEYWQGCGTGGSTSPWTGVGKVQLTSTSWQRYSIPYGAFPSLVGKTIGDTDSKLTIQLFFSAGSDYSARSSGIGIQNVTIDIWGLQIEEGIYVTPFEQRSASIELRACQRFFQHWQQPPLRGLITTPNWAGRMGMTLPVPMRAAPGYAQGGALYIYDGSLGSTISIAQSFCTPFRIEFDCNTSGLNAYRPGIVYQNGSGYLQLSADL